MQYVDYELRAREIVITENRFRTNTITKKILNFDGSDGCAGITTNKYII